MVVEREYETFYTGCDQVVQVLLFSDTARSTRYDASGKTVKVRIKDTTGGATTYTATPVTAASGNYTITLDSSQDHSVGKFTSIILVDDLPYDRPKVTVFAELP